MSEYVTLTERVYSTDPDRPRYVMFYEGQTVARSVLEALGVVDAKAATKSRPKKDIEDKAVKPATKTEE